MSPPPTRSGDGGSGTLSANELTQRNVKELLDWYGWNQATLADKCGKDQPWVSRRLTGTQRFKVDDVELIAAAFGIEPYTLLLPGGIGKYERRRGNGGYDRRSGTDRRRTA